MVLVRGGRASVSQIPVADVDLACGSVVSEARLPRCVRNLFAAYHLFNAVVILC